MKIQQEDKYSKTLSFPSENIPQSMKNDPKYFLNCANAMLSKYVRNKTAIPYTCPEGQDSIEFLRSVLAGTNSPNRYKNWLVGPAGSDGKRNTTMNISWRIPQILPEKMDVVKGYIMKLAYDISAQAIDMQANLDKEMIIANMKLMTDDKMNMIGVQINEAAGGRRIIQQEEQPIKFKNAQQVELFAKVGGVLLEQEASIKILLKETFLQSDWEGISEKIAEDILAAGHFALRSYNDKGSDVAKIDWVDIARCGFPDSKYNDYRDMTWFFEIRDMTIAQLRTESGLDTKKLLEIARMCSSDSNSSQYMQDFYYQAQQGYRADSFGMSMIDNIVVQVADCVWTGTYTDTIKKFKRKKEGNLVLEKKTDDYTPSDYSVKQGVEVEKNTRQCIYKTKLVIGSDNVFDYGQEYNQSYVKDDTGKQKIVFPRKVVRTGSTSLTARAIGFADDLALAVYKKRNALKKLPPPPGVYIEKSAFENVMIGGNKVTPKAAMKLFQDEGYLIGDTQNLWGTNTVGRQPITEIPSGIISQLTLFNSEIEFNTMMIESVTGINGIFSGQNPATQTGLGVSKIAINATMNAIYPVVKALKTGREHIARVCAKKWQVASLAIDEPGRKPMPHDRALRFLKPAANTSFNDLLIEFIEGPTDEEKGQLLQDIRDLQNIRRQSGAGGIRGSDYIMIEQMIKAGNITQARLFLAQVEEYIEELDQSNKDKIVQQNIDSQMQSNQQTAENEIKVMATEEQLQGQREAQNIQLKVQGDLLLQREKAADDRRLAAIQNVYQRNRPQTSK